MKIKTNEDYTITNGDYQARVSVTYVDHEIRSYPDYVDVVVKDEKGSGGETTRIGIYLTTEGVNKLKEFALTIQEVIQLLESKL